jgi:allantoinase
VCSDGVRPASIHIDDGRIARIGARDDRADIEFGDLVISPGLVDTHVHVNEPGRTAWEGFDTATRAAAAGGVTTIVDMPLNSVPATTTVAALEAKRSAARGQCHVDVGFWGGVVPGNAGELDGLVDAGVRGFKCFLAPSGVDEFPMVGEADLREALPALARRGVPLLVHAEDPRYLRAPCDASYGSYLSSRPPIAERAAIDLIARLADQFHARVHIVHVACAEGVDAVARAKAAGVRMTAETCPHYLTFAADDIPADATEFKCAPPIREAPHREALWRAMAEGTLDVIATDHSPAPPALKAPGDFARAWGGIASLELSLAACNTGLTGPRSRCDAARAAGRIAAWMSAAPARLAALDRKGRIEVGCDADVTVWDPGAEWKVDAAALQQRHKVTPYADRTLRGTVHATYVRGECVWRDGALVVAAHGQLL